MRLYIPFLIPLFVFMVIGLLGFNIGVFFLSVPEKYRNHAPALSETSIYPPGRYIFSTTLTLSCFLMILLSIVTFFAMKDKILSSKKLFFFIDKDDRPLLLAILKFAVLVVEFIILNILLSSGLFLLLLGVVPIKELSSETEWEKISTFIHLTFTMLFFLSSVVHMWSNAIFTVIFSALSKSFTFWIFPKLVLCALVLVGFPIAPIVFAIALGIMCPNIDMTDLLGSSKCELLNYQKLFGGALLQYYFVLVICSYFLTYWYELRGSYLEFFHNGRKVVSVSNTKDGKEADETQERKKRKKMTKKHKKMKKNNKDQEDKLEMRQLDEESDEDKKEFIVDAETNASNDAQANVEAETVDHMISKQGNEI